MPPLIFLQLSRTAIALIATCFLGVTGQVETLTVYRDTMVVESSYGSGQLGGFIFVDSPSLDYFGDRLLAHEQGHWQQEQMVGVYSAVAIPSLIWNVIWRFSYKTTAQYFEAWPERWADALGGVER